MKDNVVSIITITVGTLASYGIAKYFEDRRNRKMVHDGLMQLKESYKVKNQEQ